MVKTNKDHLYSPLLANGEPTVAFSGDNMIVIVSLKSGLYFYDGDGITATDILFTYRMLLSPLVNSNNYYEMTRYFDSNASIVAINDLTVQFTFNQHYPYYKELLDEALLSETTYGPRYAIGDFEYNNPNGSDANGAGPFRVDYINGINEVHLIPNPYWQGQTPELDELVFKYVSDKDVALIELDSRDVDILGLSYFPYLTFDDLIGRTVNATIFDTGAIQEMSFNHDNGYLNGSLTPVGTTEAGKAVRKAFSHMIPRETIIADIMDGLGTPASTLISPIVKGLLGTDTYPVREYNVATAKGLMEQAGFDYSVDVNLTLPITADNCLFEVYMLSPNSTSERIEWATLMENELPLIGVNVAYHQVADWGTIAGMTFSCSTRPPTGGMADETTLSGWDLFFVGLLDGSDYNPFDLYDSNSYLPSGMNFYNFPGDTAIFASSSWDGLLANLYASTTQAEVNNVVALMEAYHYEWEIAAPIFNVHRISMFQLEVTGLDPYLLYKQTQQWELIGLDDVIVPELDSLNPFILVLGSLILALILRRRIK
ncbi:MAG: ABC transporter substrate-binding protein [Candidatus Kariarchaeaceae archaeon]